MRTKLCLSILIAFASASHCVADDFDHDGEFSETQIYASSGGLRAAPRYGYGSRDYHSDSSRYRVYENEMYETEIARQRARRERIESQLEQDRATQEQRALYRRRVELDNRRVESDVGAIERGNNINTVNQVTGAVNNIARVGNYINQIFSGK